MNKFILSHIVLLLFIFISLNKLCLSLRSQSQSQIHLLPQSQSQSQSPVRVKTIGFQLPNDMDMIKYNSQKILDFYREFLLDYVKYRKWRKFLIIYPQTSSSSRTSCELFVQDFFLLPYTVFVQCVSESAAQIGLASEPIVDLDFLRFDLQYNFVHLKSTMISNHKLNRPILILSYSDFQRDLHLKEILAPDLNTSDNYVWTLASKANGTYMTLESIFGVASSTHRIFQSIGFWNKNATKRLVIHSNSGLSNFHKKLLRITTLAGEPFVFMDKSGSNVSWRGYLYDIIDTLSIDMNFTFEISTPPDNQFGAVISNGKWSGMVGVLQKKESEIAMMSFSFTLGRKHVMDFSPPVEHSYSRLLIRSDLKAVDFKWSAFLEPFHLSVWISIPIIIILGSFILINLHYWGIEDIQPGTSIWILSTSFLQRGSKEADSVHDRGFQFLLTVGSIWILAVIIYTSYTARLTSFLAAITDSLVFSSLEDALNSGSSWTIGLVKGSSFVDRVKDSEIPELKLFAQRIREEEASGKNGSRERMSSLFVNSTLDGIIRVYQERFILFTSEMIPNYIIKNNCSYAWLPGPGYMSGFGYMGYQKDLAFKDEITQRIIRISQSGHLKRLFRKWWGSTDSCFLRSIDSFYPTRLVETCGAFLLLFLGMLLALFLLLIEFYYPTREHHFNFNNSPSFKLKSILKNRDQKSTQSTQLRIDSTPVSTNETQVQLTAETFKKQLAKQLKITPKIIFTTNSSEDSTSSTSTYTDFNTHIKKQQRKRLCLSPQYSNNSNS